MDKIQIRSILLTWVLPIVILLGINVGFLYPAYFSGAILDQDDIKLGYAKSKEIREYREQTGEEPLWTNAMFSGMPTTQISTKYGGNIFQVVFDVVQAVGGKTSSTYIIFYLMLAAFIGLKGMGVNHWLSTIGGFLYGYSGFFIIGYAAGHNAKVNTAAFIPLMVLGMLLLLQKKNWRSFAWMALFAGLSIHRNHFQITYYTTLLLLVIWLVYLVQYIKEKELVSFAKYTGLLLLAGVLALGPNFANIWSTKVYTKESMRGGTSELTQKNQNQGEGGLSFEYAMSWSAGIYESVAMVIPDAAGGGAMVNYKNKKTASFDKISGMFRQQRMGKEQAEEQANRYLGGALLKWTGESMGNGAYYVGAVAFLLFVLAFFTVGGATRQWVIASTVLFLLMGWGSNAEWFNKLLFNYLPLYNKFRVPSMAMTALFFIVPFYGILGVDAWFKMEKAARWEALKKAGMAFGGFLILFGFLAPFFMNMEAARDAQLAQQGFDIDMLIQDRKSLIFNSTLRTLLYGGLAYAALFLFHKGQLKQGVSIALVGLWALLDLGLFDRDQLEVADFQSRKQWEQQYAPSPANQRILQDQDPHFRVWNTTASLTGDSYTSFHHKSIGGYHGAKLQRYQDLIDQQLNKQNMACFNMLNTKWVITQDQNGRPQAQRNPQACGNAWAVEQVNVVANADAEMNALSGLDPTRVAVIDARYEAKLVTKKFSGNSQIKLENYDPKRLEYSFQGDDAFVVFSEIYYEGSGSDWQAYLDGEPVDHIRCNYLLRGMSVPAGAHKIVFEYAPKSFYTGRKVNMAASGVLVLLLAGMAFSGWKAKSKKE